eukprot:TRINITY_DN6721_c0_g1_i3.p1 TRINITY_DN6721_c0_g1~~TRINITY_DN6721_c0_g1_i3.p1  ORF type:complete len:252 (+),score=53.85 TRINITY_DN6721_c0_g1_i3:1015-1770(+)
MEDLVVWSNDLDVKRPTTVIPATTIMNPITTSDNPDTHIGEETFNPPNLCTSHSPTNPNSIIQTNTLTLEPISTGPSPLESNSPSTHTINNPMYINSNEENMLVNSGLSTTNDINSNTDYNCSNVKTHVNSNEIVNNVNPNLIPAESSSHPSVDTNRTHNTYAKSCQNTNRRPSQWQTNNIKSYRNTCANPATTVNPNNPMVNTTPNPLSNSFVNHNSTSTNSAKRANVYNTPIQKKKKKKKKVLCVDTTA